MKRDEVKNIFPDATDEQISALLNINSADIGKAKGKTEELTQRIAELETERDSKSATIAELEKNKADINALNATIASYKKADEERQQKAKEAEENARIGKAIDEALNGKKFVNDMTRRGYADEVKKALADPSNMGKGVADILNELTKDTVGIFVNPQHENLTIPPVNSTDGEKKTKFKSFF